MFNLILFLIVCVITLTFYVPATANHLIIVLLIFTLINLFLLVGIIFIVCYVLFKYIVFIKKNKWTNNNMNNFIHTLMKDFNIDINEF
jgi:heme/copper-type cytochrome/quinol oxidase subunit 2